MEKLDCMYVHGSKISDPHLAASSLATATISAYFTMVSDEAISRNRDALIVDLQRTIEAQRLVPVWWRNTKE